MGRKYGADHQNLGAKVGPKIALLVSDVLTDHLKKSSEHRAKIGLNAALKFFKTIEVERDTHTAPLLNLWLGHEQTHEAVERALRFIHHGEGELASMLSMDAVANATATSIGSGLANLLAPANQAIMYADPAQILEPQLMASLAAAQIVSPEYAAHISQMSGLPGEASRLMLEAAYNFPSIEQAITLLRRKEISFQEAAHIVRRAGLPEEYVAAILSLRVAVHSPEDLALMVLKGIKTEAAVVEEAEYNGYDQQRLNDLILMSGEPPGLEQLQEYYRRGFINGERFEHGVRESRVKDEWVDVLLEARFQRASPSDALRGVIQHHLSDAEGKAIAEEGGLSPKDWDWLVETEGNPAAPGEMIELWRRGKTSQPMVEQAIREGRTKNKYIPDLVNLKRAIPSLFQITKMLSTGSITPTEGARLLHELGYEPDVVTGIIHSGTHETVVKEKELAKTEILELFYDHAIDDTKATDLLKALGYTAANCKLLIALVNLKREKTLRQAAMSPIRSAYLARHIDEAQASKQLDQLGIPHEQRDFALSGWKVDRAAHTKMLTEAQIVKASEVGLIDDADAEGRLETLGYSHADARLLLDLEKGRSTPAP
jgi:hypothetical protein